MYLHTYVHAHLKETKDVVNEWMNRIIETYLWHKLSSGDVFETVELSIFTSSPNHANLW